MSDLRKRALGFLARREHSCSELKQKLLAKADDESDVDHLLAELREEGLQSDDRFADSYVRYRSNAGFGPLRIEQELKQRGVASPIIFKYLIDDDDHWHEHLQAVWQKKYHDQQCLSDQKIYAKQLRFCLQRGFKQGLVVKFLNRKR